jgi:hypothetical protein
MKNEREIEEEGQEVDGQELDGSEDDAESSDDSDQLTLKELDVSDPMQNAIRGVICAALDTGNILPTASSVEVILIVHPSDEESEDDATQANFGEVFLVDEDRIQALEGLVNSYMLNTEAIAQRIVEVQQEAESTGSEVPDEDEAFECLDEEETSDYLEAFNALNDSFKLLCPKKGNLDNCERELEIFKSLYTRICALKSLWATAQIFKFGKHLLIKTVYETQS